ncbi:MAG: NAD(P)-dependent oxidoreductase, partial [Chloroflexi bacterium]
MSLTHADVEVTDAASVAAMMGEHEPELVLNMAAFHKVDVCEEEVE